MSLLLPRLLLLLLLLLLLRVVVARGMGTVVGRRKQGGGNDEAATALQAARATIRGSSHQHLDAMRRCVVVVVGRVAGRVDTMNMQGPRRSCSKIWGGRRSNQAYNVVVRHSFA